MKTRRCSITLGIVLGLLGGVAIAASDAPAFRLPLLTGGEEVVGKKILVVRFQASW